MAAADTIQGTQEWKDARIGIITASRIADIIASPKKKGAAESTSRINYRAELVSERTTGQAMPEGFTSWHTRRGNELEPDARCEYEARRLVIVRTAGLVIHPDIQFAGASPDGLIDPDGMCQIKCPIPAVHIAWVKANCVPREHIPQMQWEMACDPLRKWNDFVSYNRHFAEPKHLFIKRLYRDDEYIAQLVAEVHRFNAEVNQEIAEFMAIPAEESSDLEETLRASVEQVRARKALEVTEQDGAAIGIPIEQQVKEAQEKVVALRRGKIPDNPNPHDFESAGDVVNRAGIRRVVEAARSGE